MSEVEVKTSERKKSRMLLFLYSDITLVNPAEKLRNSESAASMKLVSQLSVVDHNIKVLLPDLHWCIQYAAACSQYFQKWLMLRWY